MINVDISVVQVRNGFGVSPLVGVDLSLLADEVGETAAHSPDGGQRVLHL